jgi:hypothetical protein
MIRLRKKAVRHARSANLVILVAIVDRAEGLAMGIGKATLAGALTSLIVITTGPARAYDFSKPLSCAMTEYDSGSAMWTWVDVSNGTGNRVVKEAGPILTNGRELSNHTPAIWTWSDDIPNDRLLNRPVPKGSLTLAPLDRTTTRIIAFGVAKMTNDGDAVHALLIRDNQVAGVGTCWRKT